MPKMISELAQGNQFSRSADGGPVADTATRVWKIILDSPNESIDIMSAVGVQIGDPYNSSNPIPCVSVEGRADGESRLVRIVTAQYRTTVGDDSQGQDAGLLEPDVRPANVTTSTSLYEVPAVSWKFPDAGDWETVANPVGDPVDGVMRLEPITTIRVTQFSLIPGTVHHRYVGHINDRTLTLRNLGGEISFEQHTVLFRGVESSPHVERFGLITYRGFMNTYEFAYRRNTIDGQLQLRPAKNNPNWGVYDQDSYICGWNAATIINGYNCIAYDPEVNNAANLVPAGYEPDIFAMPLKIDTATQVIKDDPYQLSEGVEEWDKVRAHVKIVNSQTGAAMQNPSAMPIALGTLGHAIVVGTNENKDVIPPIIQIRQVQPDCDLKSLLQLRLV